MTTKPTMQNYHFTFRLSGLDCKKQPVRDHGTLRQTVRASSKVIAEKRLRSNYYKSVSVDIQSVHVTE